MAGEEMIRPDHALSCPVSIIDTENVRGYVQEMGQRETKNISFTPELSRFVDEQVKSGRFHSASEVIRAGLRLLAGSEIRSAELDEVRKKIAFGIGQLDQGKSIDGKAAFRELKSRRKKYLSKKKRRG